jgi:hypothetical protein
MQQSELCLQVQRNSQDMLKQGPQKITRNEEQKERQWSQLICLSEIKLKARSGNVKEGNLWIKNLLVGGGGEKEIVHHTDKTKETVSKTNFIVSFLCNVKNTNRFVFPDDDDDALAELSGTTMSSPKPISVHHTVQQNPFLHFLRQFWGQVCMLNVYFIPPHNFNFVFENKYLSLVYLHY